MFLIVGIGNILLSDEGIGIHLLKDIEKDIFFHNKNIYFVDLGTSSIDIISYLKDLNTGSYLKDLNSYGYNSDNYNTLSIKNTKNTENIKSTIKDNNGFSKNIVKRLVIIDSIKNTKLPAGTVLKLSLEDLEKKQKSFFSLHQMELIESLRLSQLEINLPEILILGIIPFDINTFSLDLSIVIKLKYPKILKRVKKEIINFFYHA